MFATMVPWASAAIRRFTNPGPAISAPAIAALDTRASTSQPARSRGATPTFLATCKATLVA
ncbi:Uncharacterised protein [Mycobacteroides abscessus subsp. abscessus]|nr:Uncharacterised protein [Mycobacteroides abscessus subsp. abscessus]